MKILLRSALIINLFLLLAMPSSLKGQVVYKTPSGERYHLAECNAIGNASEKLTIKEAVKLGLTPCQLCKPPVYEGTLALPLAPEMREEAIQCKGLTTKGEQCKRMTKNMNGFCYQHQPDKG